MVNQNRFIGIVGTFFIIVISLVMNAFFSSGAWNFIPAENQNYLFCLLGTGLFFWSIWSWYYFRKELLCPYLIFLTVAYVFMFGQSILQAFRIPLPPTFNLSLIYPSEVMLTANIFTYIGLGAFHLGALMFARKRSNDGLNDHLLVEKNNRHYLLALRATGWIFFFISMPFAFKSLFQASFLALKGGYAALYDPSLVKVGVEAIDQSIALFFMPALFCLLISAKNNRFVRWFAIFCLIANMLTVFFIGGRSKGMVIAICIICIWHYEVKRIKGFKALTIIGIAVLLISFMPVIYRLRSLSTRSIGEYIALFLETYGKENLIVESIAEMGGTMFPLINVIELAPIQYPFRWGSTYFYAFTTIVPNLGFWPIHPGAIYANLNDWLQAVLGLRYGPGFSMLAEAYLNFGWGGVIIMFVLGGFYGFIFSLVKRQVNLGDKGAPLRNAFVFSILALVVMTNRNSFIATVRAFIYYGIPMLLFSKFLSDWHLVRLKKH